MTLINADRYQVRISLSHAEFELLRGYVEHNAEINRDLTFEHPELVAGFRESFRALTVAHQEGAFDE